MKTIRSFLAVDLDLAAVRAIADEQRALRDRCDELGLGIRWVAPQNLHVTIRFLGQVTEPMIHALEDALAPTLRRIAPFDVEVEGLGAFPDADRPRVVWVGIGAGREPLERLFAAVSKVLDDTGFRSEEREFRSHVTIGRVKSARPGELATALEEGGARAFGSSSIRHLVCYRSDLKPKGADYGALWRLPLAGRGGREDRE